MKKLFIKEYQAVRQLTETLCVPLLTEDYVIQGMADVSPPKWHLAHTTWFFETFILIPHEKSYVLFNSLFQYLFNSYYQMLGTPYPRAQRGTLARPSVETVYAYRQYVNQSLLAYLEKLSEEEFHNIQPLLQLGMHHEQQHQELLLMDIKYNFYLDAHWPVYQKSNRTTDLVVPMKWVHESGGECKIGFDDEGFCFDNELSVHRVILSPWEMASRLVTNAEYLAFIDAKGYETPAYWLSDGWDYIQKNKYKAPLYWEKIEKEWHVYTLNGLQNLNPLEPVAHISFYEADAYARWRGVRLPTETEWEYHAKQQSNMNGNFLDEKTYHPKAAGQLNQLFGDLWEWTASAYQPYPGFKTLSGAVSEYNGKFMSNQMVLRGGACITPKNHIRPTYRNFYQPDKRWVFSGIRLAKDVA